MTGGVLVESLASLYIKTKDRGLLDLALRIARYSFRHRGEATGLVINEPDVGRWDSKVCTTEVESRPVAHARLSAGVDRTRNRRLRRRLGRRVLSGSPEGDPILSGLSRWKPAEDTTSAAVAEIYRTRLRMAQFRPQPNSSEYGENGQESRTLASSATGQGKPLAERDDIGASARPASSLRGICR